MSGTTLARRRPGGTFLLYVVLTLGAAAIVVPLLNIVLMSFKTLPDMARDPMGLPTRWMLSNYASAWSQGNLGRYLLNSTVMAVVTVTLVLLCSSLTAYVLARYEFRGGSLLYMLFLAGLALPIQLIGVPLFVLMTNLGLINSLASVILVYSAAGMSFSVFLLVNFFRTVPNELEEAAVIEGAGPLRIYAYIMLPLVRPALATAGMINFVSAWNALFFPLIFLNNKDQMTVTVGVLSFIGQYNAQWNLLLPALVIVMLPTVIVFSFASRHFIRGLTGGAIR